MAQVREQRIAQKHCKNHMKLQICVYRMYRLLRRIGYELGMKIEVVFEVILEPENVSEIGVFHELF